MNYTYLMHPLVKRDYDDAYRWYEDKQKGLGERFIQAVRIKIEKIAMHPEIYGRRDNKKFREARVDIFPYLIVYKINKGKKEIYISSIHHMRKHPRKKIRKE